MSVTLRESQAITALAGHLYDFLPGSGNSNWKGHVTFRTVAQKVGVGEFWLPGSKLPAVTGLLERTLAHRRQLFERLVLEIVRAGILYRKKQGSPLALKDIDQLNGLLLEVGFKFPDLWDGEFREALRMESPARAQTRVAQALREEELKAAAQSERTRQLGELQQRFFTLHGEADRSAAGLALEKILNRLFALEGLAPREPFRVVGEQIDGSFELDHETYLVEAKWLKDPVPELLLLEFRGVIEGKSAYTRGVFIALNGISPEAQEAITRGKQPTFFVMDGYDLTMILSESIGLQEFLRQRRRLLAEEGVVVVPFSQLWTGSRNCRN